MKEYIYKRDFVLWFLSLILIYGVYTETGWITSIFALLVMICREFQTIINRIETAKNKQTHELLMKLKAHRIYYEY